jgi:cytochrome P450
MPVDFEPYSNDWKHDPYSKYRELRDASPIHWAPVSRAWCVTRYEDVVHVLTNPERFDSRRDFQAQRMNADVGVLRRLAVAARWLWGMRVAPWAMFRQRMLILEDGETHRTMRNLVNRGFTPRRIHRWEQRIVALVAECMERVDRKQRFDLVQDLAIPVPVTVISEMLGVEPERREEFKHWSDVIIASGTGSGMGSGLGGEMLDVMVAMKRYLGPIVKQRRREPRDDLVSVLVEPQPGDAALSDHEIFMFFLLLLIAGNETTTNLLGNAVDALLAHPAELERVASDPSLIPGLVEETLRWDAPVQFINRTVVADVELGGQRLKQGDVVLAMLGSANRDERRFTDPDRFDPGRDTRGHVGFGLGAHFCLGASLARLEARCALAELVPRLPRLARVRPEREFLDSYTIRGRARLELRAAA